MTSPSDPMTGDTAARALAERLRRLHTAIARREFGGTDGDQYLTTIEDAIEAVEAAALRSTPPSEPAECPICEGDGEVYRPTSIPDDEGYEPCPCCGGSGAIPTAHEIAELRNAFDRAAGDLAVAEAELAAYKERYRGDPHPFDAARPPSAEAPTPPPEGEPPRRMVVEPPPYPPPSIAGGSADLTGGTEAPTPSPFDDWRAEMDAEIERMHSVPITEPERASLARIADMLDDGPRGR